MSTPLFLRVFCPKEFDDVQGRDHMSRRIPKEIKGEIIGKVQAGERVADLAEQYAVSTKTIYGWLRQDTGEAVVSMLQYHRLKRKTKNSSGSSAS